MKMPPRLRKLGMLFGIVHLAIGILLFAAASQAQLAAPNQQGVSMGHVHILAADVDASEKFWIELGGKPIPFGQEKGLKFPGVLILLRKGDPAGGTVGSVINHIGFHVADFDRSIARWKAAGLKMEPGKGQQVFLYTPDGLTKIEILPDTSLKVPIAFHHVHFFVHAGPDGADPVPAIQAWYIKMFGAVPGTRAGYQNATVPGGELTFTSSPTPTVGTKGRSVDHIGFEVKNLEEFCKKLEAKGVKLDTPYTKRPDLKISMARLTDPWGTYLELTEGFKDY